MAHVGLVGIGVMGAAFALNLAQNGHSVSLLDRTIGKSEAVKKQGAGEGLKGELVVCKDAQALVESLPKPRSILVLVPSGGPLKSVIEMLKPLIDQGDLIADLGNSNFRDTQEQTKELEAEGFAYLGMGISGGEEGARNGPSIMAGGSIESWARVEGALKDASAKFEGTPCCDWFGPGGAGHFIKTLHNGIEYADMQSIAGCYGLMRSGLGMSAEEISQVFASWMNGPLNSYLIEIAAEVAGSVDPKTKKPVLDIILDTAGQKGTGRWSVIEALHLGAPNSLIAAAVEARGVSALKDERIKMEKIFGASPTDLEESLGDRAEAIAALEQAMIATKICAYSQGFDILARASKEFEWDLDLAAISRVWRAGCIIRSVFLDEISDVYDSGGEANLLLAPSFSDRMKTALPDLQKVVATAVTHGQPVPVFVSALHYFNMMRTGQSTANMIQGLRDFFGAHGFERVDDLGVKAHGPWGE